MGRIGGKRKVLINDQRTCGEKKLLSNDNAVQKGNQGVVDDVPKGDQRVVDVVQKGDQRVADEELKGDQGNQKGTNGPSRPKKYHECTDEELFRLTCGFRHKKISLEKGLKEMPKLRQYLTHHSESRGFDVTGPIPKIEWMQGYVKPLTISTKKMQKFVKDLAQMAIQS